MRSLRYWTLAMAISGLGGGMTACSSEAGDPAAPPMTPSTSPPTSAPVSSPDDTDRLPEGQVAILAIDQATRDQLKAAAGGPHAPGRAGDITAHGTIYDGEVYGKTQKTDTFYVLALLDQMYVWQQKGDAPWTYKGAFDARVCAPPIPRKLYTAWGVAGMFPSKHC
jgi:hypothetical protein